MINIIIGILLRMANAIAGDPVVACVPFADDTRAHWLWVVCPANKVLQTRFQRLSPVHKMSHGSGTETSVLGDYL